MHRCDYTQEPRIDIERDALPTLPIEDMGDDFVLFGGERLLGPRVTPSGWYSQFPDEDQGQQNENHGAEDSDEDQLSAAWRIINSEHTRGDQTKRSPHYIDADHEYAPKLAELEQNATAYRSRQQVGSNSKAPGFRFKRYQRDGIGMLAYLEKDIGAILLADDTGLGKSVQWLALTEINPAKGPSLMVAPAGTLHQWVMEAEMMTGLSQSKGEIILYKGEKNIGVEEFQKASIVITSYDRLRIEHGELEEQFKNFETRYENPWVEYRKDDRVAEETEGYNKMAELLEIPLEPIPYVPVTTERPHCPLFGLTWGRVGLDEGHAIRNKNTRGFKAADDLAAIHRGLLTGTPFANEYTDLQSISSFSGFPYLTTIPSTYHFLLMSKGTGIQRGK
jgi:SNF2 family DNA or RNA helicase